MCRWFLVVTALSLAACRDPTQIVFELSTDADCADVETGLVFGPEGALDLASPVAVTSACDNGRIGTITAVPSGDDDAPLSFAAALAPGGQAVDCAVTSDACIIARRRLRYIPHTGLRVPVEFRLSCQGVICPLEQTCVNGGCTSDELDPNTCALPEGCDETSLPPPEVVPTLEPWSLVSDHEEGVDAIRAIVTSSSDEVFVAGVFSAADSYTLGSKSGASQGGRDGFVAAFTPTGETRWITPFGGDLEDSFTGLALSNGRLWAAGSYLGTPNQGKLPHAATRQVMLVEMTTEGDFMGAFTLEGVLNVIVAAGPGDDIFVAGATEGGADVGGIQLDDATQAFVARMRPDGTAVWATPILEAVPRTRLPAALVRTSSGAHVAGVEVESGGFHQAFDEDGMALTGQSVGGDASSGIRAVAADDSGTVYVLGDYGTMIGLDLDIKKGPGNLFIAAYQDGALLWAKGWAGTGAVQAQSIAVVGPNALVATGTFQESLAIGTELVAPAGAATTFEARFDKQGTPIRARPLNEFFGVFNLNALVTAAPFADGHCVGGSYAGTLLVEPKAFTKDTLGDAFLWCTPVPDE